MINFKDFKITKIDKQNTKLYNIYFSYFIGEENRRGSIHFDCVNMADINIYTDFENSPEEILARDVFRLLPNGELEYIPYPNDEFFIGEKMSPRQEEFLEFLKSNGAPVTPEEGELWYWKLYHNWKCFGNYNKSSL